MGTLGATDNGEAPVASTGAEGAQANKDTLGGWQAADPGDEVLVGEDLLESGEPPVNWADQSHAYVTDQAQALTEWMDSFFGDPNYDIEKPESLLRLEWVNSWDEEDDESSKLRLRGKLQLPAISKRLKPCVPEGL